MNCQPHPSLLPAYQGYRANKKLLNDGKSMFGGCSCHLVNELPDDGPIIIQSVVPLDEINEQRVGVKIVASSNITLRKLFNFSEQVRVNKIQYS